MLGKAARVSKAEENMYLLQLLVIADLNRKKCFGDSLNLWRKVPYLCPRTVPGGYRIVDLAQVTETS